MWEPDHYLRFADHRTRPGLELAARIPDIEAKTIVDLGSGTGHLTALLAQRWPRAHLTGVDGAAAMVERARADHPSIEWVAADLSQWEPEGLLDVVYSNAALHWLDHHESLFTRIRSWLAPGGVLAVQMPDNWAAPTHQIPAQVLDDGSWPEPARLGLMRDRLAPPTDYARWLAPATVDLWRTTYYQPLSGHDAVWNWVTGSLLIPVIDALSPDARDRFAAEVQARYRRTYPADANGVTTMAFSRLFIVATID